MPDPTKDSNPADSPIACAASGPADGQEPQGPPPEADAIEKALDDEMSRWQDTILEVLTERTDCDNIDGSGCDSGDPLDLTVAEIHQAITYLIDKHDERIDRLETARLALQAEVDRQKLSVAPFVAAYHQMLGALRLAEAFFEGSIDTDQIDDKDVHDGVHDSIAAGAGCLPPAAQAIPKATSPPAVLPDPGGYDPGDDLDWLDRLDRD